MIDYDKISQAMEYYQSWGYTYLDAPWLVSERAMSTTAPVEARLFSTFLGHLVASGEQSFIEMWLNGDLPEGRFLCATPCFRDEPVVDELRRNYFFKVELIHVNPGSDVTGAIDRMIREAEGFFNNFAPTKRVPTELGTDLEIAGVEVGSYGFRQYHDLHWVYGTGCAEPRLSQAMELWEKSTQ